MRFRVLIERAGYLPALGEGATPELAYGDACEKCTAQDKNYFTGVSKYCDGMLAAAKFAVITLDRETRGSMLICSVGMTAFKLTLYKGPLQ